METVDIPLWFAVHANRRAGWITPAIQGLTVRILQDLEPVRKPSLLQKRDV